VRGLPVRAASVGIFKLPRHLDFANLQISVNQAINISLIKSGAAA